MQDESKTAETEGAQQLANNASRQTWRIFGWLLLGFLIGGILAVAFIAYGQAELLLEQLNLRYCG